MCASAALAHLPRLVPGGLPRKGGKRLSPHKAPSPARGCVPRHEAGRVRIIYHSWLLDELSRRFGEDAVEALVARFGGMRLSVLKRPTPRIAMSLGPEAAGWLCAARGGEQLHVPSRTARARTALAARDREIAASGASVNELAHRHGISAIQVKAIRRRMRANSAAPRVASPSGGTD